MTRSTENKQRWTRPQLVRLGTIASVQANMVPGSTQGGMLQMS